jgi:primase-polymerase (primpol)-like protein
LAVCDSISWEWGWFVTAVEELVQRHFDGMGYLFERVDGGYCMSIFNSRDIATQQTCTRFDIALGQIQFFPESTQSFTYQHFPSYAFSGLIHLVL